MILAACYTVFNGLELLEQSISQIASEVDFIIIGYQKISNKGNESTVIEKFLDAFNKGRKYHLVLFNPDLNKNTKENERKKHQMMLDYARILGCTHFLLSACDHFYLKNEFHSAKNYLLKQNFDVSFTQMFTYYKYPTWQLTPIEEYYMPFIMKISDTTRIDRVQNYPVRVDPSVQVNTYFRNKIFGADEIMLHHYSMIRKDIRDKFLNAAASIRWSEDEKKIFIEEYENYSLDKNEGIKYFGGRKVKPVENYFNL